MAVNVQFGEEYSGPSFEGLPKNCIPISPVTAEWQSFSKTTQQYSSHSRKQIPLSLAWAVTVHKSQGQTLPQVVISLQKLQAGKTVEETGADESDKVSDYSTCPGLL